MLQDHILNARYKLCSGAVCFSNMVLEIQDY